jgi:hypothetical protein
MIWQAATLLANDARRAQWPKITGGVSIPNIAHEGQLYGGHHQCDESWTILTAVSGIFCPLLYREMGRWGRDWNSCRMWLTISGTSLRYMAHELWGHGAETPEASFKQWVPTDESVSYPSMSPSPFIFPPLSFSFRKKLFFALIEERC